MSNSSFKFLDNTHSILVFGRDGQVGKALQACLKELKVPVRFLGRSDCDLSSESSINDVLNRYQPRVVINAAAYTAVDDAERSAERKLVFAINSHAPALMASYISRQPNGVLVHYSTDYVFADTKKTPYFETDIVELIDPLCVYGRSKLAGERAIQQVFKLAHDSLITTDYDNFSKYFIVRTSWVYGDGSNFLRTILRLATERNELKVVDDQVGTPTSADWLAEVVLRMLGSELESGIYHVVPDGETSWYELAIFAIEVAIANGGLINLKSENIISVPAKEYPLAARRPYNSRLSNEKLKKALSEIVFDGRYPHWRWQVEKYVTDYVKRLSKS